MMEAKTSPYLIYIVLCIALISTVNAEKSKNNQIHNKTIKLRIDEYLSAQQHDATKLRTVLESGSMNGLFKSHEIYELFFYLHKKYPEYVSKENIGVTVMKKSLFVFKLIKPNKTSTPITKSKILFTGAHHARELLTTTMCLKIFIESLHSLIYNTENSSFWTFNDLLIVPIVNLDSHTYISEAYGTPDWDDHRFKRKNMNDAYCP